MNTNFSTFTRQTNRWMRLIVLLFLAACNVPWGQPSTITPPSEIPFATASPEPSPQPYAYEIAAGSVMQWMDGSEFVYVPPGEFLMGEDLPQGGDNTPAHRINLSGFWIHQTEVTNRMYAQCVALGICTPPYQEKGSPYWYADTRHGDDPVVGVDWNQAQTYCRWIQGSLPTEAEWEKAARGTEGKTYPWGEDQPICNLLNFKDCLEPPAPDNVRAYPRGASPFNAAEMSGNVFEWVNDWYAPDYYPQSPAENPTGPVVGKQRVFRGGSYLTDIEHVRVALRSALEPEKHQADLGFRCVLGGEVVSNPPPPPCEMVSFIPPGGETPSNEPAPYTGAIRVLLTGAFCQIVAGSESAVANFDLGIIVTDIESLDISSPDGDIHCFLNPSLPTGISCIGPAIQPGKETTITVCITPSLPSIPNEEPTCPEGYILNDDTGMCTYIHPPSEEPAPECDPDHVWLDGYGCLSRPKSDPPPCPPGYTEALMTEPPIGPVCLPDDVLNLDGSGPSKPDNTACLSGTYVPDQNCCQLPPQVTPICPSGYTYEASLRTCVPAMYVEEACATLTYPNPPCPPSITCSTHVNEASCTGDPACYWKLNVGLPGGSCLTK